MSPAFPRGYLVIIALNISEKSLKKATTSSELFLSQKLAVHWKYPKQLFLFAVFYHEVITKY
jgi:hypothetical protein